MEDPKNIVLQQEQDRKAMIAKIQYCVESTIPATRLYFKGFLKRSPSQGVMQHTEMERMRSEHERNRLIWIKDIIYNEKTGQAKIKFCLAGKGDQYVTSL